MASTCRQPEVEPTHAFEEVVTSASTSGRSTTPVNKVPYDVFINHRGPDVKHTLAPTLYNTFTGTGLRVFLDSEELELGDFLPTEIEAAMQSASVHIAIFSQNYAQSPWCLAELSYMLKTRRQIVPVFYHVQPDDVRHAKGVYAEAFSHHEEKHRYSSKKLQEWKHALYNASLRMGHIINNKDDERMLPKNMVNYVLREIKKVPFVVAKHPVGLDEVVRDFERIRRQNVESHSTVQVVGIWGMGGCGKTTLAKQLYNINYKNMERSSFLVDVRDCASKKLLHNKQKKLLEDLGLKDLSVDNIEEGKGILASRLRSVKVLIILDDVDKIEQLDALVPEKDNLGYGSLIVITTRECEVLRCWGISSIYKMKTLDSSHARQLFCWHAFLQPSPLLEFEDLVENFLNVCKGLPLSLELFGGQLYDNYNKGYWKSLLHKISRTLDKDIKEKLTVSYEALDDEEKQMFLHSACFFIGEKKSRAIAAWDESGWSGLHGWERLQNKCLVELDDQDCIRMHDHLRGLGKEIANQNSPYRLRSPNEQIINADLQSANEQIINADLRSPDEQIINAVNEAQRNKDHKSWIHKGWIRKSWMHIRAIMTTRAREKRQNGGIQLQERIASMGGRKFLTIFSERELEIASNNYSTELGKGGFATVYKGVLVDGTNVAIKKPKSISDEFINELIILSHISHKNVVKLLGCCMETQFPLLVYEFVPQGAVFRHLHSAEKHLTWETRRQIAIETAEAIAYMHFQVSQPIFHRDIKSSNILLDNTFTPKVADFGISRLRPSDERQLSTMHPSGYVDPEFVSTERHLSTIFPSGTPGYVDPEFVRSSQFTTKSDVFSFGVVLVELLTGLMPLLSIDGSMCTLYDHFMCAINEGRLTEILDPKVVKEENQGQMENMARVAKACLQKKAEARPSMREVVEELILDRDVSLEGPSTTLIQIEMSDTYAR